MQQPLSINRTTVLAVAGLVLILPLSAVSCSAAEKAVSCANTAVQISTDVADLGTAYNNADKDPAAAGKAVQKIKGDLDKIGRNSGDADLAKAVGDLQTQVDKVQKAIDNHETPDLGPLGDAAGRVSKVCTG
ncbi:hypothetical protein [Kitasatospora sp. CB01950]|uniref:hypothetical protein n=2 Tax=unclassified Kitasatospora TaxID=2633591 RepID=UPI00093A8800|nr:hypothetical protein [Kitasatospora sp. CB01950]OKJ06184.1 hypothetical protein AMK19_24265 [Kitasatospora sp. CB01950]